MLRNNFLPFQLTTDQYADPHGVDASGDYAETNQTVLTLPEDVGGDALELLLHGIYLQEVFAHAVSHCKADHLLASASSKGCLHKSMLMQIVFSKDNVEDVLRISDRLQVIPVKEACATWLEKELDAFNVLETLLL